MPDSAYVTLHRRLRGEIKRSVLFLRRSNGEWWLPGGDVQVTKGICRDDVIEVQAINDILTRLLVVDEGWPSEIGKFRLSDEAGGHAVYLFESALKEGQEVAVRDLESGLSKKLAFFTEDLIHDRLYDKGDMPWGQAKMAIYFLNGLHRTDRRANEELLKTDIGTLLGREWVRPKA